MQLIILITFIGLIFILLYRSKDDQKTAAARLNKWAISERLPWELRDAIIFLNERDIATRSPFPLHGRPDQVLQLRDQSLVILDTKTRDYVFVHLSDIIQLSVYAVILSGQGYRVRPYGYIRLVLRNTEPKKVRYVKVRLLKTKQIQKLWLRYWKLADRKTKAQCTGSKICRTTKNVATGK